jgi:hypothetical protein
VTSAVVLISAIVLAVSVLVVESARGHVRGQLDFLRAASAVYVLCFAVAPAYLQFADTSAFRASLWSWVLRTPFHDVVFAYASLLALIGYPFLLGGHWLAVRGQDRDRECNPPAGRAYLWFAALVAGCLGLGALLGYVQGLGGWVVFLVEGVALRSGQSTVESRWAFLSNVAPLVIGAMLLFFALRQYEPRGPRRHLATWLCIGFYLLSLLVLFNQAGRAWFVSFLITLPLIGAIQRDRLRVVHVLFGGVAFVALVVFGGSLFQLARDPSRALTFGIAGRGLDDIARGILWEFTFPITTLANAMRSVPTEVDLRWFYDFPLAFVYLIPQRLTGSLHEPTVTMVNTALFSAPGAIPVDVLSMGYYSLLVPGTLLTVTGLGALLGLGERWFPASADPLRSALRVSWILALAFRVMYADPQLFWRAGFYLILTTMLVFTPAMLARVLAPGPTGHAELIADSGVDT